MVQLIGSHLDKSTEIFTFFYHNTDGNWYYEMCCRNSFGTHDMYMRTNSMTRDEFKLVAGNRLA